MGHRAQHVGVEMFVGGQIGGLDAQQVFDLAGDVVAFAHLGAAGNGFFKAFLRRLAVLGQPDRHVSRDAHAHRGWVQHGAVAGDDAGAFQLLHPAQAGRGRQADLLRQIEIADPPVAGQGLQYIA